jgi:hypothetical protein
LAFLELTTSRKILQPGRIEKIGTSRTWYKLRGEWSFTKRGQTGAKRGKFERDEEGGRVAP